MTSFDSLRYPISTPMTDAEFLAIPTEIQIKFDNIAFKINTEFVVREQRRLDLAERGVLMRRVIFEYGTAETDWKTLYKEIRKARNNESLRRPKVPY